MKTVKDYIPVEDVLNCLPNGVLLQAVQDYLIINKDEINPLCHIAIYTQDLVDHFRIEYRVQS